MCIIIAKPSGANMPTDETIRECYRRNPDGAGIAYSTGKAVIIRKGYMSVKSLLKAVHSIPDATDSAVIIHCRIATSGGVRPDVCHPYPITDRVKRLRATSVADAYAIAHNGVINGMLTNSKTSDTMAFIRDVVAPMRRLCPDLLHNDDALDILETVASSKLAIINGAGDLVTLGDFVEDGGVYYSNHSYRPIVSGINRKGDSAYAAWWSDALADDNMLMYDACTGCPEYADCKDYGVACRDASEASYYAETWRATGDTAREYLIS